MERMRDLIENMIKASKHRTRVYSSVQREQHAINQQLLAEWQKKQLTTLPYICIVETSSRGDFRRQLRAVEHYDRAIENKALKDKEENQEEGLDEEGQPLKKKKKTQRAVYKEMSEEVKNKQTNMTAAIFAGGNTKSWMMQGGEESHFHKRAKVTPSRNVGDGEKSSSVPSANPDQYYRHSKVITVKDALFVLENERVEGARRGLCGGMNRLLCKSYTERLK